MTHPFIDIVIPVHNAGMELRECVDTLRKHTTDYRLILVDDNSDEETASVCRQLVKEDKNALLIRSEKQRWFTRASNLGLRMVRTSPSVLLNSDCILDEGWLEELFAVWTEVEGQGRKVGLVGSTLSGEEPRRWAETLPPNFVTGHCWLLNIHAISEVSSARGMPGWYLDEQKQIAAHIRSDVFLCHDLNRQGYATIASFKSKVGHHGGRSWGYDLGKISQINIQALD